MAGPRLRPFADDKSTTELANGKPVDWASFNEDDVSALVAYVTFVCGPNSIGVGIGNRDGDHWLKLCEQLRRNFYREDFSLLQALDNSPDADQNKKASATLGRVLDNAVREDSKKHQYKVLMLDYISEGKHQRNLQSCESLCKDLPGFQDKLADLDKDPNKGLQARKEACRLAPLNQEFRRKLRECLAMTVRELLDAGAGEQADPFAKREEPNVIVFEVDNSSTSSIVFEESRVSPALQDKINDLRETLKTEMGTVLPGVRFTKNGELDKGEFRVLLRKGCVQRSRFDDSEAAWGGRWDQITQSLGKAARENAASIYTLAECSDALKRIPATVQFDPICITNDPSALYSLTLVVKDLLAKQISIVSMSDIALEFKRCFEEDTGIAKTIEAVRAVPSIRQKLAGNTPPAVAVELPGDLTRSLLDFVNHAGPDAPPEDWWDLRNQIRQFALQTKLTEKHATLVTNPDVRQLVTKGSAGLGLPVLSTNEILPQLLSKARDGNHGTKATAQAAN
jgi:hypothetical protein